MHLRPMKQFWKNYPNLLTNISKHLVLCKKSLCVQQEEHTEQYVKVH